MCNLAAAREKLKFRAGAALYKNTKRFWNSVPRPQRHRALGVIEDGLAALRPAK